LLTGGGAALFLLIAAEACEGRASGFLSGFLSGSLATGFEEIPFALSCAKIFRKTFSFCLRISSSSLYYKLTVNMML
jgi:hypothetical protein